MSDKSKPKYVLVVNDDLKIIGNRKAIEKEIWDLVNLGDLTEDSTVQIFEIARELKTEVTSRAEVDVMWTKPCLKSSR